MEQHDKEYYENIITLTSYPEFGQWLAEIKKEIYQLQANLLQSSENWDQVVFTKGRASGLAYILNLRSSTLVAMKNAEEQEALDARGDDGDANV